MVKPYNKMLCALGTFILALCSFTLLGMDTSDAITYAVVAPAFSNIYDPIKLSKVMLEVEKAWENSQIMNELSAIDVATFQALLGRQRSAKAVLVNPIEDPSKDYEVEVMWPDFCGWDAVDCVQDICADITGAQKGLDTVGYDVTQCIEDSFEVSETQLAKTSMSVEAYTALLTNRVIKNILERLNQKLIAFVVANTGYNVGAGAAGSPYDFDEATGLTEVPAENWNADLMVDMRLDAQLSKVYAPFVLDGRLFYKLRSNVVLDENEESANRKKVDLFQFESDPVGFAKAGIIDRVYLVSPSAYAFVSKNYVLNSAPVWDKDLGTGGKYKFTVDLKAFGLKLDAYEQTVCEDSKTGRKKHVFLFKLNFDILPNPKGCVQDVDKYVTGIIGYKRVA